MPWTTFSPGYALLEGFLVALDAIGRVPEQEMRQNATGTPKRAQIGCCWKGVVLAPQAHPSSWSRASEMPKW